MSANGRLPASDLVNIGGGKFLRPGPAADFLRMAAAFRRDLGYDLAVTDAYRDYAAQVRVKAAKGPYAATPGTSKHGWAIALDLGSGVEKDGTEAHRWMEEHGAEYGWVNPGWAQDYNPSNGQHEPWHWEHPSLDLVSDVTTTPTVTLPATPAAPTPLSRLLEVDMPVRVRHISGAAYLVDVQRSVFRHLGPTDNSLYERLGVPLVWDGISDFERDQVRQLVRDYTTPKIDG